MPLVAVILDNQSTESLQAAPDGSIKQLCLLREITGLEPTAAVKLEWRLAGDRAWLKIKQKEVAA